MSRRRLEELADRVAALEAGSSGLALEALEQRLAAIEESLRRLSHSEGEIEEIEEEERALEEMVRRNVPSGKRLAVVIAKQRPLSRPADRSFARLYLGDPRDGEDPGRGPSAIAQLEAQRVSGLAYLLVPESARNVLELHPDLAEHLLNRYELIADEPDRGVLFSVEARRRGEHEGVLRTALRRLADRHRCAAALDWTELEISPGAAGLHVFSPSDDDGELPYLDHSIDVVLLADDERLEEARRVARFAVILVEAREGETPAVAEMIKIGDHNTDPAPLLVVTEGDPEGDWAAQLSDEWSADDAPHVVAPDRPWAAIADADTPVAAVVAAGVLPLPGCLEAAMATLLDDEQVGAVAVKMLTAEGALEAAGSAVFADGSVEGIGAGSHEVAAAWHEFARPVTAGTGMLVVRPAAVRAAGLEADSFVAICGGIWGARFKVRYQPEASAVRIVNQETLDETTAEVGPWLRGMDWLPERPDPLDVAAWRRLLAHDEVIAS